MTSTSNLSKWLDDTSYDKIYWSDVKAKAEEIASDGCSGVPDWMKWTCWEHDVHYRTARMLNSTEPRRFACELDQMGWGAAVWRKGVGEGPEGRLNGQEKGAEVKTGQGTR